MSGPGFIVREPDGKCELCGTTAETRPYGPHGERICIECGLQDREGTEKRMREYVGPFPLDKRRQQ